MIQEVNNDFNDIASLVRSTVIRYDNLDRRIFAIYDFISKVIPGSRSVLVDNLDFVNVNDYLNLLNDFEYVYKQISEML